MKGHISNFPLNSIPSIKDFSSLICPLTSNQANSPITFTFTWMTILISSKLKSFCFSTFPLHYKIPKGTCLSFFPEYVTHICSINDLKHVELQNSYKNQKLITLKF